MSACGSSNESLAYLARTEACSASQSELKSPIFRLPGCLTPNGRRIKDIRHTFPAMVESILIYGLS